MKPQRPALKLEPLSPQLRRYLYLTAMVTGAAIMIVEILGAKLLAPYFGTSHFVWTAQIAVTLVALAAGYYAGGWLVDFSPRLGVLYWAVLCAAIYLDFAMLVAEPVAYWCVDFKLARGSLMASAFLFFVPLALLAMVGPFFVRMLTVAIADVGGNVGRLTALSTLGSFAGTVLMGYVLIPLMPNSIILCATSAALMAVTAGYFFGWGRKQFSRVPVVGAMVLGLGLGGIGVANDQPITAATWREVYRANSNFGRLQVISAFNDTRRFYLNDFLQQNAYDAGAKQSLSVFTYLLHDLAAGYTTNIQDVLCIGVGVGIVPMTFAREGARVDAVEINPGVVPLAEKFFDFNPSQLHLAIDDGRHFINCSTKRYDAIILDVFLGDSSPSHLLSREAFTAIRRLLKPGGVLVINSFGSLELENDFFATSVNKTLKSVFRNVRAHAADISGNIFFAASDQPKMELRNLPDLSLVHETPREDVERARETIVNPNPDHGLVLTDDFNPAEYYDAANRETLRKNLAMGMRQR